MRERSKAHDRAADLHQRTAYRRLRRARALEQAGKLDALLAQPG
jgi:hypothetical protein